MGVPRSDSALRFGHGEHLPAACEALCAGQIAIDPIEADGKPFLAAAHFGGAAADGGLKMLLHQTVASLQR